MKWKRFGAAAAALAIMVTLGAASVGAEDPAAAGDTSPSASASSGPQENGNKPGDGHRVFGGDFGALKALSEVAGTSVDDLITNYPQKTAWQIGKELGKLDEMKQRYLENQKQLFDKMVSEGRITSDDAAKMYADLETRVAAIDGVNTVTLGRPSYIPEQKKAG